MEDVILFSKHKTTGNEVAERQREEVLNTVLAACIGARGTDASPETILRHGTIKPDVMAKLRGLRCAIEGKVADVAHAKTIALEDARGRVDQGIAHLAMAIVYPRSLRTTAFADLPDQIERTTLEFALVIESGAEPWQTGGVSEIVNSLRRLHEIIVRDDVLQEAVGLLTLGIEDVANAVLSSKGTTDRLITVLGVGERPDAPAV
jgi:hypothetical protein